MASTLSEESKEIVKDITSGGSRREKALKRVYENKKIYQSIAQVVSEHGGYTHDIQEIYQETIILFDKMVRSGKYKEESNIDTFIIGIGRNLCRNWSRNKRRVAELGGGNIWLKFTDTYADRENIGVNDNELKTILSKVLDQVQPICRTVLRMWQLNYSMEEIAEFLDLGNAANARKRKYRCIQSLMNYIRKSPATQNYLKEIWKTAM